LLRSQAHIFSKLQKWEYPLMEILNHRCLDNPHIVRLNEVFLTSTHLAIVMEYGGPMNLAAYITAIQKGPLAEALARFLFQQLICGVDYSHRQVRSGPTQTHGQLGAIGCCMPRSTTKTRILCTAVKEGRYILF
jgi:serine/threonine protein kinase